MVPEQGETSVVEQLGQMRISRRWLQINTYDKRLTDERRNQYLARSHPAPHSAFGNADDGGRRRRRRRELRRTVKNPRERTVC